MLKKITFVDSIVKFLIPTRLTLLIIAISLIVFLGISFWRINQMPVFGDEAIYVRWAQIIKNVETLRFVPLTDGKQPFFMWLNAGALKFFSDPLLAGRIVALVAGALTLITASYLASLFIPSAFIPVVVIFTLNFYLYFYSRLALADSLLSFFGIASLLFSLLLSRFPRLDLALLSGLILGLAWITKSPAIYFFILFTGSYFFLSPKNLFKPTTFFLPFISLLIGFVIYNLLRLGPQFQMIAARNLDYLWPLSEIIKHPFDPLLPHLKDLLSLSWFYLGPLFLVIIVAPFIKLPRHVWVFFFWWLIPTLGNLVFAKVLTGRYLLYTIPPLLLFIGYLFSQFKSIGRWLLLFALLPSIFKIINLNLNTFNFTLPAVDQGYLRDWTSGWGIKPAANYLIARSKEANVIVGTEGYFGTLPQGLEIYTDSRPRLTILGVGLGFSQLPVPLTNARDAGDEVYLLINRSRNQLDVSVTHQLKLIDSFAKPGGDFLDLFLLAR